MEPAAADWTAEPFVGDDASVPFERFVRSLSDFKFVALRTAMDRVLLTRGIDLGRTSWLRTLGGGLHEFRVRHEAHEIAHMFGRETTPPIGVPAGRVLLRVFVHFHGDKRVLLLGGYDKGDDPSPRRQQREIDTARRRLAQFKERQRRRRQGGSAR